MISDGENAVSDSSVLALIEVGIPLGRRFFASDAISETPQAVVDARTNEATDKVLNLEFKLGVII
jgi:hypothetical protein